MEKKQGADTERKAEMVKVCVPVLLQHVCFGTDSSCPTKIKQGTQFTWGTSPKAV